MARTLARFTITDAGDDYTLHIEDDAGDTVEMTATYEQLDLIAEAIDEHLDDGDFDEVDDDEAEDEKTA